MSVAVEQAGRGVHQVNESRLAGEMKGRKNPQGNLLEDRTEDGLAVSVHQVQMNAADLARRTLGEPEPAELGRNHEVFGREANCSRTHRTTSSTPSP